MRRADGEHPWGPSVPREPSMASRAGHAYSYRMVLRYHQTFGQWYVPNLRAYVRHERGYFIVKTNRVGMRSCRDDLEQSPQGRRRMLVFGDSFTAGWGVNNEERFSDRLEKLLNGVDVLNFGLDGSGIDQQFLIFERLGSRFGGDIILFCPLVENIRRVTMKYWMAVDRTSGQRMLVPKPYCVLDNGALQFRHMPVPRTRPSATDAPDEWRLLAQANAQPGAMRRFVSTLLRPVKPLAMKLSRHQPFPQYDAPDRFAWQLTQALLRRLLDQAGPRHVILAPLPTFHYIEGLSRPTYLDRYREFATRHRGVSLVDVLPAFRALSVSERRACRYPHDIHYTPFAHAVVARVLAKALTSHSCDERSREYEPLEVA